MGIVGSLLYQAFQCGRVKQGTYLSIHLYLDAKWDDVAKRFSLSQGAQEKSGQALLAYIDDMVPSDKGVDLVLNPYGVGDKIFASESYSVSTDALYSFKLVPNGKEHIRIVNGD